MAGLTRPSNGKTSELLFSSEKGSSDNSESRNSDKQPMWKIMIIDDEQVMHDVSRMVLRNFSYKNRSLQFLHGYSGDDAIKLLKEHSDTAIIILDVVMETDTAGLDTVKYIREKIKNKTVRIILRTGQPGQAPEHVVVRLYDINDYLDKSKLTSQYLEISLITSLRSYDDICTISQLTRNNDTLESLVMSRTKDLSAANMLLKKQMDEQAIAIDALRVSEARLAEAQRIASIGHFEWNYIDDKIIWSQQIYQTFKIPKRATQSSLEDFLKFIAAEDQEFVKNEMNRAIKSKKAYDFEHRLQVDSNEVCYVRQQGDIVLGKNKDKPRLVGTIQNITERRLAEFEMRKLSLVVEQVADSIMITDAKGTIEYSNPAMSSMTGYSKKELVGKTPRLFKSGKQSDAFYSRMWDTIKRGLIFSEVVINKRKDGRLFYEEKTITPQTNPQGEVVNFISSGRDITDRIEAQERLQHLAHHDTLTGLPNRILLQDRLEQAISRAGWRKRKIAVLFLDMDRFKVINDTLGHNVGDSLLKDVAQRLSQCIREGDSVARFGGDEFTIVLNDINATEDIPMIAEKILTTISTAYQIDSRELFITTSIGISQFPDDGDNGQTLLKKADAAMYNAKRRGKNNYIFYTADDEDKKFEKLTLESELRRALERNEFVLHYQPQLSLSSCKVESYEALIRWQNPNQGFISPIHFIGLLEETGMIIKVGEWVLNEACSQEKSNQLAGNTPKRIAVNISVQQFKQKNFVDMVVKILRNVKLAPEYLELEVTEGILIDDIEETSKKLESLHSLGITLSIDDFGTGYSSMNYLRRLPFDLLKIDRSFITELTTNSDDGAITAAIITLAHSMGLEVIAEGVETMEQLQFLDNLGCDSIQGYLCSPPLPSDAFESMEDDLYLTWKTHLNHCD